MQRHNHNVINFAGLIVAIAFAATVAGCADKGTLLVDGKDRVVSDVSADFDDADENDVTALTLSVFSDPSSNPNGTEGVPDDALTVHLTLGITKLSDLPIGEDIAIDGEAIAAAFNYECDCTPKENPQAPPTVTGTLRIEKREEQLLHGQLTAELKGAGDANPNVDALDIGTVNVDVVFDAKGPDVAPL